MQLTQQRRFA